MKVLGINGSPRKGGNTELLIREVFKTLEAKGIKTEFCQLGGKKMNGCIACMKCRKAGMDMPLCLCTFEPSSCCTITLLNCVVEK